MGWRWGKLLRKQINHLQSKLAKRGRKWLQKDNSGRGRLETGRGRLENGKEWTGRERERVDKNMDWERIVDGWLTSRDAEPEPEPEMEPEPLDLG